MKRHHTAYRIGRRRFFGRRFHLDVMRWLHLELVVVSGVVQQVGVHPQGSLWELPWSCHLLLGGLRVLQGVLAGGVGDQLMLF